MKANVIKVSKKRSSDSKKKAQYMKRARAGMRGFVLSWASDDPFSELKEGGEITDCKIDHANPTQKLICISMWQQCAHWIVETEFQWSVIMRVIFEGAPRGDVWVDCDFNFTCSLRGKKSEILNDAMEVALIDAKAGNDAYQDGHKNKGTYSRCEFLAQVVGV